MGLVDKIKNFVAPEEEEDEEDDDEDFFDINKQTLQSKQALH